MKISDERVRELREQWTRESEGPYDVLDAGPDILELLDDRNALLERVKEAERESERRMTAMWNMNKAIANLESRLRAAEEVVEQARKVTRQYKSAGKQRSDHPVPGVAVLAGLHDALRHYDETVKG